MKKMLILTLLSGCFAFGQNCKYKRNVVDEFTNKKILETKEELLTMSGMGLGFSCTYNLLNIDGQRFLKLNIHSPSIFTIREGSEILFKTNAETPIKIVFGETVIADGGYNSSLKSTHWKGSVLLPIPESEYSRLQSETITKMRVTTADGYIDDDIKPKHDKKFKEHLKCI